MRLSSRPPQWLYEGPIAHRGLHNIEAGIPENSLKSFSLAMDAGYAIELDVRVCHGEEVIVFHDDTLERACGNKRSSNEIKPVEINQPRFKLFGTEERIPLLREVFDLIKGRVPLLIEIKRQPGQKSANFIILNNLLQYDGPVAIQSFDPFILSWFRKHGPKYCRGQLAGDFSGQKMHPLKRWLLSRMVFNALSKPAFIAYDISAIRSRPVLSAKRDGYLIIGWTTKNAIEASAAADICDNFIFENYRP